MHQLLCTISRKYNIDMGTAENLVCESLRKKKVYDALILGQCFYNIIEDKSIKCYSGKFAVHEVWGSGQLIKTEPVHFIPIFMAKRYIHWWKQERKDVMWKTNNFCSTTVSGGKVYKKKLLPFGDIKLKPIHCPQTFKHSLIRKLMAKKRRGVGIVRNKHFFKDQTGKKCYKVKALVKKDCCNKKDFKNASLWLHSVDKIKINVTLQHLMYLCLSTNHAVHIDQSVIWYDDIDSITLYEGKVSIDGTHSYDIPQKNYIIPNINKYINSIHAEGHLFIDKVSAKIAVVVNYFFDTMNKKAKEADAVMMRRYFFAKKHELQFREQSLLFLEGTCINEPLFEFISQKNGKIMIRSIIIKTDWRFFCQM
jgi:hypothetical protein